MSRARAQQIVAALRERYPDARCALVFDSPFQLLIATILSAQSTDAGVNKVTPALFARFPGAAELALAEVVDVEPFIRSLGLYRNKARSLVEACRTIVSEFAGTVPGTMDGLLRLRGVARKTANVVLSNAFGVHEGIAVDTHVQRLAARFGLARAGATPSAIEKRLMALVPREDWGMVTHLLIAHGRAVCTARGSRCAGDAICRRFCSNAGAGAER